MASTAQQKLFHKLPFHPIIEYWQKHHLTSCTCLLSSTLTSVTLLLYEWRPGALEQYHLSALNHIITLWASRDRLVPINNDPATLRVTAWSIATISSQCPQSHHHSTSVSWSTGANKQWPCYSTSDNLEHCNNIISVPSITSSLYERLVIDWCQ